MSKKPIVLLYLAATAFRADAIDLSVAGSNYTQNFDTLAVSGTNVPWSNDNTLPGWSMFNGAGAAITTYNASDGGSSTGSFYSFGPSGAAVPDRALGGLGSGGAYFASPATGAVGGWMAVSFQNTSGSGFNGFNVSWNGEQWRDGGSNSLQTMVFQYGIGSSFGNVATWLAPGGLFDFSSPVYTATAGSLNGNAAGLIGGLGGSVTGLTWNSGDRLWLRWAEKNDAGNDHALAIDDFSFTARSSASGPLSSVPDGGTTFALFGMTFGGLMGLRRRFASC